MNLFLFPDHFDYFYGPKENSLSFETALESTQPLTEMSGRNNSWEVKTAGT